MKDNLDSLSSPSGVAPADSRRSDVSEAVRVIFKCGSKRRVFVFTVPPFPKLGSEIHFEGEPWVCVAASRTKILMTLKRTQRKPKTASTPVPAESLDIARDLQVNPEGVR